MRYGKIVQGKFISRPNRFIANVEVDGQPQVVHVKNTGRCKELLLPDATVWLEQAANPNRRTAYDLVGVKKERQGKPPLIINMDSQAPNQIAEEWLKVSGLFSANATYRREYTHGKSRFDFYICDGQRKAFLEVKGVTLEHDGVAMFPDAPTLRGVKHVNELAAAIDEGYEAYILFVIQMKGVTLFKPNDATHPEFGDSLRRAAKKGVQLLAVDCIVNHPTVTADELVKISIQED